MPAYVTITQSWNGGFVVYPHPLPPLGWYDSHQLVFYSIACYYYGGWRQGKRSKVPCFLWDQLLELSELPLWYTVYTLESCHCGFPCYLKGYGTIYTSCRHGILLIFSLPCLGHTVDTKQCWTIWMEMCLAPLTFWVVLFTSMEVLFAIGYWAGIFPNV